MFSYVAKKIVGTQNQRILNRIRPLVGRINELEASLRDLPADAFPTRTAELRAQVEKGRTLDEVLP